MRVRYHHWLNRRVGYEAMLAVARRAAHAAAAASIEAQCRDDATDGLSAGALSDALIRDSRSLEPYRGAAEEIAGHWEHAGDPRRAGAFFVIAAQVCERKGEFARGTQLCGRAEGLLAGRDPLAEACRGLTLSTTLERVSRFEPALAVLASVDAVLADSAQSDAVETAHAAVLAARAFLHFRTGRPEEALGEAREACARAAAVRSTRDEANAWNTIGNVQSARSDWAAAEAAFTRARAHYESTGELRRLAVAMNNLAECARVTGRLEDAERGHEEALALKRRIGDRFGSIASLNNLAILASARGDESRAEELLSAAVAGASGISEYAEGLCLMNLGNTLAHLGREAEAAEALTRSRSLRERIGDRMGTVYTDVSIAGFHLRYARPEQAYAAAARAIAGCAVVSLRGEHARALALRTRACLALSRADEARSSADEALAIAKGLPDVVALHDARLAVALAHRDPAMARLALDASRESGNRVNQRAAEEVLAQLSGTP